MRADNMVLRAQPITIPEAPAGKAEKHTNVKVTEKPFQSALAVSPYAEPPPKVHSAKSNKATPDVKAKKAA